MIIIATSIAALAALHFSCPACGEDLLPSSNGGGLRCINGHFTNVAKEGHIHLLPPSRVDQNAQAASDAIVRAQRAFYEHGGFQSQCDAIADEVVRALANCPHDAPQILNAGCGEGVFMRTLARRLETDGVDAGLWATDTSKLAVRYAAKRHKQGQYACCSPHALPFKDGSMSVVFSTFAPSPWDEFCRVLKPGGAVIVARAGSTHLHELRSADERREAEQPPKQFAAGLAEQYVRVCTDECYSGASAVSLREMVQPGVQQQQHGVPGEDAEEELRCTVDVIVSTHRVWLGTGGEPL